MRCCPECKSENLLIANDVLMRRTADRIPDGFMPGWLPAPPDYRPRGEWYKCADCGVPYLDFRDAITASGGPPPKSLEDLIARS